MNHSYETDWLLGFMYNNKMNILGVNIIHFFENCLLRNFCYRARNVT